MTKASKASVHYTDHAENHEERCALCKYFRRAGTCAIVLGKIAPAGWCEEFSRRARSDR
jgi:hypothetical protein